VTDHRTGKGERQALTRAPGGRSLTSTLVVRATSEVDLSLVGGEPMSLVRAGLRRAPDE